MLVHNLYFMIAHHAEMPVDPSNAQLLDQELDPDEFFVETSRDR